MNSVLRDIITFVGQFFYWSIPECSYPFVLKIWFRIHQGYPLDLEHPRRFTEKIQWLKLHDTTPLKTQLSDKYRVRSWVAEKIGEEYLIPLLGVWDRFEDIDFDKLPNQFVLKANHGCAMNIIVRDKRQFDQKLARNKLKKWMRINFAYHSGLELQYRDIKPKIIAETYMENTGGDLDDYKVFCFNGKAEFIRYGSERHSGLKMAFFDRNWKRINMSMGYPSLENDVPRPDNLNELLRVVETLAKGFKFVRIDFYRLDTGEYKFGEMTFTPSSGLTKWTPPENDIKYGDMIKLPTDRQNSEK